MENMISIETIKICALIGTILSVSLSIIIFYSLNKSNSIQTTISRYMFSRSNYYLHSIHN